MSSRVPIRSPLAALEEDSVGAVPRTVQRRRAAALRVQRRRALVLDLGLGFVLAMIAIAIAPGLAMVALGASLLLLACGASLAYERLRARRATRSALSAGCAGRPQDDD